MKARLIITYLLNILDLIMTNAIIARFGLDIEANPLMRKALEEPWIFAAIKLVLFPLLLIWMWKKKRDDSAYITLGMFIVVVLLNIRTVFFT